jgi:hypothetical protein
MVEIATGNDARRKEGEDQDERIRNTPFFLYNGFHRRFRL